MMAIVAWVLVTAAIVAVALAILRNTRPTAFREVVTVLFFFWCAGLLTGLIWVIRCVWGAPPPGAGETTVDLHWTGSGTTWPATAAGANAPLMLAGGALGGAVHTARSLASKTGAATFQPRWAWWYLLTPLIGAAAGFVVTLGVQGGALDSGSAITADTQNALATFVAFVSGLFARAALERLERFLPRPDQAAGQVRVFKVTPNRVDKAAIPHTFVRHRQRAPRRHVRQHRARRRCRPGLPGCGSSNASQDVVVTRT